MNGWCFHEDVWMIRLSFRAEGEHFTIQPWWATATGGSYMDSILLVRIWWCVEHEACFCGFSSLSTIVTKSFILDAGKGPAFGKKKPFNYIQKPFMTETTLYGKYEIISTIAGPSLLPSSKIELFATVVKGFQLYFRCWRQPISTFDYNVWQQKKFTWRKQLSSSSN